MSTSKKNAEKKLPANRNPLGSNNIAPKATAKSQKKVAPKKTQPSVFILPEHGDKVSPANGELASNGRPLVFEVDHATGNASKNEVFIKPVGNSYTTGQWQLVDRETEVNF